MNNRMKVILSLGAVAIAATYALTRTGDSENALDDAYERKLAELRAKQKAPAPESRDKDYKAINASTTQEEEESAQKQDILSSPQLAEHIKHHVDSTLHSLNQIIPLAKSEQSAMPDDNQSRMAYLDTMPIGVIEATQRDEAKNSARKDAGRQDPFSPLASTGVFPKAKSKASAQSDELPKPDIGSGPDGLPPPPPQSLPPELTPPPEASPAPGISSEELPPPPDKPLLMRMLRLNGIVGDRAILTFKDRSYQRQNGFKRYITLAEGQRFDNMRLVHIDGESAVLEEDGEETTIQLAPIR